MPLCHKQSRRSRDAPICGAGTNIALGAAKNCYLVYRAPPAFRPGESLPRATPLAAAHATSLWCTAEARTQHPRCRSPPRSLLAILLLLALLVPVRLRSAWVSEHTVRPCSTDPLRSRVDRRPSSCPPESQAAQKSSSSSADSGDRSQRAGRGESGTVRARASLWPQFFDTLQA